jgi:predicted nuclease of restriction endonuclease-like (RecB) superfamily
MKKNSRRLAKGPIASTPAGEWNFAALVSGIHQLHRHCSAVVHRTVNTTLTLRNWVIGSYIIRFEQMGLDRAQYGNAVIDRLSEGLKREGLLELTPRYLRLCRQFASMYPEIWRSATAKSTESILPEPIRRSLTANSAHLPTSDVKPAREIATLIDRLSFTHFEQLIAIEDPLKRSFYEIECIRGHWSVRVLKRQIGSLYFERSGLSKDKEKLSRLVNEGIDSEDPNLAIRDPYVFEFLGIKAKDAVVENDLEATLIEHLREFLLELGHGFCLEAQQKSIVIGRTRGYVDLVFYHRILKCHVLVELKVEPFRHEHLGQLNTYVSWYRENMMVEGDNPPVGLLLCTEKDRELVHYATASLDSRLFVSKYAIELPTSEEMALFVEQHRMEFESLIQETETKKSQRP